MFKSILVVLSVVIISIISFFVTYYYYFPYSIPLFLTLITFVVTFTVRYIIDNWLSKRFFSRKVQFSFRRVANLLYIISISIALLAIWVEDTGILFVSSGILGAGIAVALQDVFKNVAGGLILLINKTYKIGDRIEVDGKFGDVLDIGLFNTALLEIQEWIDGDQATGRITIIPNAFVLSKQFNNYNKEYNYIWDEITLPITYDSDWHEAYNKINAIVQKETKETAEKANQALEALGQQYYLTKRYSSSAIYLTLTDNWVSFKIRYTTEIHNRRTLNSKISQRILEEIQRSNNIHIASTTLSVSGQIKLNNQET
jgi:small-conductance mechanosensitive channel